MIKKSTAYVQQATAIDKMLMQCVQIIQNSVIGAESKKRLDDLRAERRRARNRLWRTAIDDIEMPDRHQCPCEAWLQVDPAQLPRRASDPPVEIVCAACNEPVCLAYGTQEMRDVFCVAGNEVCVCVSAKK